MHLHHLTLETGHSRRSPRSEVAPHVIQGLTPVVRAALFASDARPDLPGIQGFALSASQRVRKSLLACVWLRGETADVPVVTFGVALDSRAGAALWRALLGEGGHLDRRPPQTPWLVVRMEDGTGVLDADTLAAIADLERCIAWTWIAMGEAR